MLNALLRRIPVDNINSDELFSPDIKGIYWISFKSYVFTIQILRIHHSRHSLFTIFTFLVFSIPLEPTHHSSRPSPQTKKSPQNLHIHTYYTYLPTTRTYYTSLILNLTHTCSLSSTLHIPSP